MVSYINSITLKSPLYLINKGKDQQDKISILTSGIFVNDNILSPDNEFRLHSLFKEWFYFPEATKLKGYFHITGNNQIIDINKPCIDKVPYWLSVNINLFNMAIYQLNKEQKFYDISTEFESILNDKIILTIFDTILNIKNFVKKVYNLFEIYNYQEIVKGSKIEISTDFIGNFQSSKINLLRDISRYEECISKDLYEHKNNIDNNTGFIVKSNKNIQILEPVNNIFINNLIKNTACRIEDNTGFKNISDYNQEQLKELCFPFLNRNSLETYRLNQLCQRNSIREEKRLLKLGIKECKLISKAIKIKPSEVSFRSLKMLKKNNLVVPYNPLLDRQQFYIVTI